MSFWFQRFNSFIWLGSLPKPRFEVRRLPPDRCAEYEGGPLQIVRIDPRKCKTRAEVYSALLHEMVHHHQNVEGDATMPEHWHSPAFYAACKHIKDLTGLDP